jgi:heme exporter protein C
MRLTDLANPSRFLALTDRILPWLAVATLIAFAFGISQAYFAPDDYQQGATVKIMFIHVPAAWLGTFAWILMSIAGLGTLVWRHPLADVAAKAAAPIGAAFTLMCLVTGSLWGRPMWGTYWVWDARLTSVLVLFLMYLGVIALWRTIEDPTRAARVVAVLTLVGAINIPIIKFSVDWWNTLHQPASVLRLGGSTIHPTILVPLIVMLIAFTLLFLTLHLAAMRNEIMRRRVRTLADHAGGRRDGAVTMNLGPHVGFIVTAYVAAIAIVAGLVAWIVFERRHLNRVLNEFEAHGIRRRSGRAQEDKA